MPTATKFPLQKAFKPTWYVYDQFSFDPLAEFEFPPTALAPSELRRASSETNYNRAFGRPYAMETFSGETPQVGHQPVQLGRYKYFYFNQRNDVTSLLKHNGQSLHSYLYDEYGQLYDVNKKPKNASNFTDPHNHYTFSGKEFDEESSLNYFGARYYDSWSGTWATQDTYRGQIENPASLHRYGFTENNPINNIDLYGFKVETINGQTVITPEPSGYQPITITSPLSTPDPFASTYNSTPKFVPPLEQSGENQLLYTPNAKLYVQTQIPDVQYIIVTPSAKNNFCKLKVKERDQIRCLEYAKEEELKDKATETRITLHLEAPLKGAIKEAKGDLEVITKPKETLTGLAYLLDLFVQAEVNEDLAVTYQLGFFDNDPEAEEYIDKKFEEQHAKAEAIANAFKEEYKSCSPSSDIYGKEECAGRIGYNFIPFGAFLKILKIPGKIPPGLSKLDEVAESVKAAKKSLKGGAATMLNPYELEITHGLTKSKKEFIKLKEDIRVNGIQEPIKFVEYNGKKYVVDGHHRLRAAKELGINSVPVQQVELPYAGYKTVNDLIFSSY